MSMGVGTVCVSCQLAAPIIGDWGYIGRPSPSEHSWEPDEDVAPSFGYVFLGLEAIGMVTWELTQFRDFLVAHSGHNLRIVVDEDLGASPSPEVAPPVDAIRARFEQKCYDCRRRRWSEVSELVLPRPELRLSPSAIEVFTDRVPGNLINFSYHAAPFGDEDEAARVASFLSNHSGHQVYSAFLSEVASTA